VSVGICHLGELIYAEGDADEKPFVLENLAHLRLPVDILAGHRIGLHGRVDLIQWDGRATVERAPDRGSPRRSNDVVDPSLNADEHTERTAAGFPKHQQFFVADPHEGIRVVFSVAAALVLELNDLVH